MSAAAPEDAEPAAPIDTEPAPAAEATAAAAPAEGEPAPAEEGEPAPEGGAAEAEAAEAAEEPAAPEEPTKPTLPVHKPDPSKDIAANESFVQMAGLGQIDLMQAAMDSNPDISLEFETDDGWTPMSWAAGINNVPAMRFLDEQGAAIDNLNKYGNSAVRYAACNGKLEAVQCLLELGADCNMLQQNMYTPFIAACGKDRSIECVRAMMDYKGPQGGAKLHYESPSGKTPLHEAALCGANHVLKMLLQNGAKVQTENLWGRTALMEAVMYGRCEAIELLHQFKAKIEHKSTKDNLSALDLALREKQRLAAGLLQKLGSGDNALTRNKTILSTVDREAQVHVSKIINQRDGVNCFFNMMKPGGLLEVNELKPLTDGKLSLIERDYQEKGLLEDLNKPTDEGAGPDGQDKNWADVKHNHGKLEKSGRKSAAATPKKR